VHAIGKPERIAGPVVDVFDPRLPVLDEVTVQSGQSRIYRDVREIMAGSVPGVLHCTHRLMAQQHAAATSRFTIRGPAETPAVVRFFTGGRQPRGITGRTPSGEVVDIDVQHAGRTLCLRLPNVPQGVEVEIAWE